MAVRQDIAPQAVELPNVILARAERGAFAVLRAYLSLTKPRIVVLLLVTTVPAMIVAQDGWPSLWLVLVTLAGGTLSAGGANAINCYIDRDIDGIMSRTRGRPIPSGAVEPERALLFGIALGIVGFAVLAAGANLLSASLATSALTFYVVVYTLWLKRGSPQNIVIGGAAGAIPPVIGWSAVTGGLDWPALVMFAIIFLWTPPHFWALALRYRADYARARIPMLPVVRGELETNRQILIYSIILVVASLMLAPVAGMGPLYFATALVTGAGFLAHAYRLWRSPGAGVSMSLFFYSLAYLGILFVTMGVDRFVRI